jgi:hypothetical protein
VCRNSGLSNQYKWKTTTTISGVKYLSNSRDRNRNREGMQYKRSKRNNYKIKIGNKVVKEIKNRTILYNKM